MYGEISPKLRFTQEDQRLLHELAITETYPGPILHDFEVLLNLLRERKPALTEAQQLPMQLLAEVNQRLQNPIQMGLKRPQQKSYPHIHGLYLLVRASGLTYVDTSGKKPVIVIDEAVYQQWLGLNSVERYGNLLETWFLRGHAEIIGEDRRPAWGLPDNLNEVLGFVIRHELENGLQIAGNRDVEDWLKYEPGKHNLGLLDLFGFITIQSGTAQTGEGWRIEQIRLTPVGKALLALLYEHVAADYANFFTGEAHTGKVHEMVKAYFPEWKTNLTMPSAALRAGRHVFKVSLGDMWRRIAVDGEQSLDDLAMAIIRSVQFDSDHLYRFVYRDPYGCEKHVEHPYMQEEPLTSEIMVGEVPLRIGQAMIFLFDFGDNWEFEVLLEAHEPERTLKEVEFLETHGAAPEQYPDYDYDGGGLYILLDDFDYDYDEDDVEVDDVDIDANDLDDED